MALIDSETAVITIIMLWMCSYVTDGKASKKFTLPGSDCNQYLSGISGAEVTGRGLYSYTDGCELELATGTTTKWMFHISDMSLMNCYVSVLLYDRQDTGNYSTPLFNFRCASKDPGIVLLNTSYIRLVLLHSNKTNFNFKITFTARKPLNQLWSPYPVWMRKKLAVTAELTYCNSHHKGDRCNGFVCQNRLCIPNDLVCDKTNNCFDNSDESANSTAYCIDYDPFPGENFAVLISVVGGSIVMGTIAFCCRMIRRKRQQQYLEDDLDDFANGPYVKKYAYMYAVIKPQHRARRNRQQRYMSQLGRNVDHSVDEPEF